MSRTVMAESMDKTIELIKNKTEIEALTAKVAELEADLLRARNSDEHNFNRWQAEQNKVKMLVDAIESIRLKCADQDVIDAYFADSTCCSALATVKGGK